MNMILPPEIFSKIFGSIDKDSRKNASQVCKLWLNFIRNDIKFSSGIKMTVPIENGKIVKKSDIEKMLSNWPVLKTLEIRMAEKGWIKEINYSWVKEINYSSNSLLERVTIYADFSKEYSMNYVSAIVFDPRKGRDIFKLENILKLTLVVQNYAVYEDQEMIEQLLKMCENAVNLEELRICSELTPKEDDLLEKVLVKIGTRIKYIDIDFRGDLSDDIDLDEYQWILSNCPNVISFTIDGDEDACNFRYRHDNSALFYQYLFTKLQNLQKYKGKITSSAVMSIQKSNIKVKKSNLFVQ